jgi:hypothetical protein
VLSGLALVVYLTRAEPPPISMPCRKEERDEGEAALRGVLIFAPRNGVIASVQERTMPTRIG